MGDADELVLTDEELAAVTGPDAPRPVPLDHADGMDEAVRRRVLLSALRSLGARGLVASGAGDGRVVAREPLASMLGVRSRPTAVGRLDIVASDDGGAEELVCFVGEGSVVVETRFGAGMHHLARRSVDQVAGATVAAAADAGGLPVDDPLGGGADDAPLPAGRGVDDPELGEALRSASAVARLVVRHRGGTQASLSLVVAPPVLWVVVGGGGADDSVAYRVAVAAATSLVRAALVP